MNFETTNSCFISLAIHIIYRRRVCFSYRNFHKNSDAVYFYDLISNKQSRQITNFNFKHLSFLVGIPGEKANSSRILSDYMKISSQNFWQDSGKNSGWNYWFHLITFNKPYLGKASIFSAIPLHWSSRWISWAIDIIYRPAVATPWVHCIFIGYVSIQHTDLLSIINNRNTFFKIKTFF